MPVSAAMPTSATAPHCTEVTGDPVVLQGPRPTAHTVHSIHRVTLESLFLFLFLFFFLSCEAQLVQVEFEIAHL